MTKLVEENVHMRKSSSGMVRSARVLVLFILIGIALPFAFTGWSDLYREFLERQKPTILIDNLPRGVGRAPVKLLVELNDPLSGLDEVVIRATQRRRDIELLREKLSGEKTREVELLIDGERSGLEEGELFLNIRAFDRSFWSNRAELEQRLVVDFKLPSVKVVSTQHNARLGGSQLVFYQATDENLAISGVRVGSTTFAGYPAKSFDPEFSDPTLYGVFYSVGLNVDPEKVAPRVFAEDSVGNAESTNFYNKAIPRRVPTRKRELSEALLRERVPHVLGVRGKEIQDLFRARGMSEEFRSEPGTGERLIEQFIRVEEIVRRIDDNDIRRAVATSRYDWYLNGPLSIPLGTPVVQYGDRLNLSYKEHDLGTIWSKGYQFGELRGAGSEVVSAGRGVVVLARELGSYGLTVVIDHGLGLSTVYSQLGSIDTIPGRVVEEGEIIAETGRSGLADRKGLYFEVRIQGEPVDPREWWDARWYFAHVSGKIQEVKSALGLSLF